MGGTPYDQAGRRVRLEWGPEATTVVTPGTIAVVVDVLSFTTCVGVAADRGVAVLPWRSTEDGPDAHAHAAAHAAELARPRHQAEDTGGVSLSPHSIRTAPGDLRRLVLPSPNGSTVSLELAGAGAEVVAASLRNRTAVAAWLADRLADPAVSVALVPAGERWGGHAGPLRVALEDAYGVGAVLEALLAAVPGLTCSPEARSASAAWHDASREQADVVALLAATGSGRELVERGYSLDVEIAGELDSSDAVPVLQGTSFVAVGPSGPMRAL